MKIASVEQLWRYPVKSMGGERLDTIELGTNGVRGDRAWAVRDEVRGGIRGAKKIPALMQLAARYASPPAAGGSSPAEIVFADGSRGLTSDADISERLSRALDHEVTLWPLLSAEALDHYRRGAPAHEDMETELRAVFGRTAEEPLPDLTKFPLELMEFESPPGTYFDAFPLLVVTRQSLASLAARATESLFDVRRFRPNLLLACENAAEPFPELAWAGKRLRVGEATLELTVDCPRCVMITHGFAELPKDPRVMRTVVREAGGSVGVYATVAVPGVVHSGDAVELLD